MNSHPHTQAAKWLFPELSIPAARQWRHLRLVKSNHVALTVQPRSSKYVLKRTRAVVFPAHGPRQAVQTLLRRLSSRKTLTDSPPVSTTLYTRGSLGLEWTSEISGVVASAMMYTIYTCTSTYTCVR